MTTARSRTQIKRFWYDVGDGYWVEASETQAIWKTDKCYEIWEEGELPRFVARFRRSKVLWVVDADGVAK
jgi:hypothetical protein